MKRYLLAAALLMAATSVFATVTAPKIVVVNGGKYEFAGPFQDYVTVGVYDRATRRYTIIDTILDQSVQDVVTIGRGTTYRAYVLTQNSVTSYDLNTNRRLAQRTNVVGGAKLALVDPRNPSNLILTQGFGTPSGTPYVSILDQNTLATVASITGISKDCGHVLSHGGKAFVAVPGGWADTTGAIAEVDLVTNTLVREYDFGKGGSGIANIYYAGQGSIIGLCSNGYQSPEGRIAILDLPSRTTSFLSPAIPVGAGAGLAAGKLFANFTRQPGIGVANVATTLIDDSLLIARSFATAKLDSINNQLVLTDDAYTSAGKARIYSLQGVVVDSFQVGISPEALAIAYYDNNPNNLPTAVLNTRAWTTGKQLYLNANEPEDLALYAATGTQVWAGQATGTQVVNLENLAAGVYWLRSATGQALKLRLE